MDETSQVDISQDCGVTASSRLSSTDGSGEAARTTCDCHGGPICKDCKRARNRQHTENHRKRILTERELFLSERDDERKKNHLLQGELETVQTSLDTVMAARQMTCPSCNNSNVATLNRFGAHAAEAKSGSGNELARKLEVCQRFVSGLKPASAQHQPGRTKKCMLCINGTCNICVRNTNTLSKSAQCRRNKDNNFTRCVDLLQWATNELFQRLGETASLRRQLNDALKQLFGYCAQCGRRLASPQHLDQTAYSTSAPYTNTEPAPTYTFDASEEPLLRAQSNTFDDLEAFDQAYRAMYDTSQNAPTTDHPLSLPQPIAPTPSGWHDEELDWDIISQFLTEQRAGESSSNPSSMRHLIGLSYNESVGYAWGNLSSNDEAPAGVDELAALLSDVRLTTVDHVAAQLHDAADSDYEALSLTSGAAPLSTGQFERNGTGSLSSAKCDTSSKSEMTSAVNQVSNDIGYLQVIDELGIPGSGSKNYAREDSPKSSNSSRKEFDVKRRSVPLLKGKKKNKISADSFDQPTTFPQRNKSGVIAVFVVLAIVVGVLLEWKTRRKQKERKNVVSKSTTTHCACNPVMIFDQAHRFRWDPFDNTRVWPRGGFPLIPVEKLQLNQNPENYFAKVEHTAFGPGNLLPGIENFPDKMLLPPKLVLRSGECRDAKECCNSMTGDGNGYDDGDDDNFTQPRTFSDKDQREALVETIVDSLKICKPNVQERGVKLFAKVSQEMGTMVQERLSKETGSLLPAWFSNLFVSSAEKGR